MSRRRGHARAGDHGSIARGRLSERHKRELVHDLARSAGGVWVTCAGRSMEPTIKLGDRVRVEACNRVRTGDVVLFEGSRSHVLHRVLFAVPGTSWFVHIGDAGSEDGPGLAHAARVVGRAELRRRLMPLAAWRAGARRVLRAGVRRMRRAASGERRR